MDFMLFSNRNTVTYWVNWKPAFQNLILNQFSEWVGIALIGGAHRGSTDLYLLPVLSKAHLKTGGAARVASHAWVPHPAPAPSWMRLPQRKAWAHQTAAGPPAPPVQHLCCRNGSAGYVAGICHNLRHGRERLWPTCRPPWRMCASGWKPIGRMATSWIPTWKSSDRIILLSLGICLGRLDHEEHEWT